MANEPTKMWSGRFREPLHAGFESWQRSFPFDIVLLAHELEASRAHAKTIAAVGVLSSEELSTVLDGLTRIPAHALQEVTPLLNMQYFGERMKQRSPGVGRVSGIAPYIVMLHPEIEDVHHFVEAALTEIIGPLALKLHTGRSRNEQIATDLRLYVREGIDRALTDLAAWADALVSLAENCAGAVMPSYTHLQRAEPVLVAHWLLAYVEMILRDCSRLQDARQRMNFCPLGSGAVAGATLALDRTIAARALGFTAPTANSIDATSDRDFALEYAQVVSTIGLHLSRFAEEITLYATAEFGFIDLPESFSTGSSAMPQKKNPDFTELLRAQSGGLLGAVTSLGTILKGLPLAYNKDLQETQKAVFAVADTLDGALPLLAPFTEALRFRFDRMQQAAQTGYLNAMAAATYLSNKGVPFRTAHEKIGQAVRLGLKSGRELNALTLEELRQFGDEFGADFYEAITLQATVDCHNVIAGTATHRVRDALQSAKERLTKLRSPTLTDAEGEVTHAAV